MLATKVVKRDSKIIILFPAKRRLSNRSTHSNTEDDHNEKLRQVMA